MQTFVSFSKCIPASRRRFIITDSNEIPSWMEGKRSLSPFRIGLILPRSFAYRLETGSTITSPRIDPRVFRAPPLRFFFTPFFRKTVDIRSIEKETKDDFRYFQVRLIELILLKFHFSLNQLY